MSCCLRSAEPRHAFNPTARGTRYSTPAWPSPPLPCLQGPQFHLRGDSFSPRLGEGTFSICLSGHASFHIIVTLAAYI